ncbi:hypothetical protein [Nocardia blacklockiae]|uniref:hypothetical protein n=1 Tax=Nocardia blacklockiae TaxID=480036 RepID=UPI0018952A2C|nr:hypothetical protein [Nocardia blacklockiae]MBF6170227.1 hypothetical protein [Nocardia blacklockiae]
MPPYAPITADALLDLVTDRALGLPEPAVVAIDGADAAEPVAFARALAGRLPARGRPSGVVALHDYVRPASLRLEFGRDETSYRTAWFDYAGVEREVLQGLRVRRRWLPALWDEAADRSARAATVPAAADTVLFVAGPMLLGRGLAFDLTVELRLSEAALRRRTAPPDAFTVDALLRHRRETPEEPGILVNWDHPDRPAVRT